VTDRAAARAVRCVLLLLLLYLDETERMSGPRTVCAPEGIPVTSLTARAVAVAVAVTVVVVVVVAVVVVTRPTTPAGPSKFSTRTRPRSVPLGVCSCSGGVGAPPGHRHRFPPTELTTAPRPTPRHRPVA